MTDVVENEISSRAFSRLIGTIVLGGMVVFLLTPPWMLSVGKTDIVIQGPPGDKYAVHYTSQKPIGFEKLASCLPEPKDWAIQDATHLMTDTDYLDPIEKRLCIYEKGKTVVHLLLIRSSKMDQLHDPSICYRFQGYEVLSEEPRVLQFQDGGDSFEFYATEIWAKSEKTSENREVVFFFMRHGLNTVNQDTYFVRIECVGKPREEARHVCETFASDLIENLVSFWGPVGEDENRFFLTELFDYGPVAIFLLVVIVLFVAVAFFWFPESKE